MLGSFPCPPRPRPHPPSLAVLLPLCHINVYLTGWKTACLFPVISERESEPGQITFPAVQGYLKVLVLPVSPGHMRTEGGGGGQNDGGAGERERGQI